MLQILFQDLNSNINTLYDSEFDDYNNYQI